MSVKIRLSRSGAKKRPYYHIVVADINSPRDGRFIEKLGFYNPMLPSDHEERVHFSQERVQYWLSKGAHPTDRVARFLAKAGLMEKRPIRKQPKKSAPKKKAQERMAAEAEAKAQAEAEKKEESAPKKEDSSD